MREIRISKEKEKVKLTMVIDLPINVLITVLILDTSAPLVEGSREIQHAVTPHDRYLLRPPVISYLYGRATVSVLYYTVAGDYCTVLPALFLHSSTVETPLDFDN